MHSLELPLSRTVIAVTDSSLSPPTVKQPDPTSGSSRSWLVGATMATILIAAIEGTIIATVMPAIVGKLGGFDLLSWAFTAYLLAQAVTIPIYGRLADLFGRKRVLLTAIALFLIGSVLCGFARSMSSLIVFRALQGIGAGGLVPIAQTIIGDIFTPAERARIQGWLSSIWAIGAIIGPLLGAFLVRYTIWPMVFWVNVPIGALAGVMLALTMREQLRQRRHRIDYLGSVLMMLSTSILMFALVDAARLSVVIFILLVAGAMILLAVFVLHERRTAEPMLPLSLWRNPIIASGNISFLALGAVLIASTVFLSLYVQGVMGRSATVAGFALGAPSVCWPIGSMLGGRLMLHASYRAAVFAGAIPFIVGSLMMIALDPTSSPLWAAGGAALIGIGMGFTNNTFQVAIQSAVEWDQRGIATSTTVFSRIIGQALGAASFGGLLNASMPAAFASGDIVTRALDPGLRESLSPSVAEALVQALAHGLHHVYLITSLLVCLVASMALHLPAGLSPVRPAHRRG